MFHCSKCLKLIVLLVAGATYCGCDFYVEEPRPALGDNIAGEYVSGPYAVEDEFLVEYHFKDGAHLDYLTEVHMSYEFRWHIRIRQKGDSVRVHFSAPGVLRSRITYLSGKEAGKVETSISEWSSFWDGPVLSGWGDYSPESGRLSSGAFQYDHGIEGWNIFSITGQVVDSRIDFRISRLLNNRLERYWSYNHYYDDGRPASGTGETRFTREFDRTMRFGVHRAE